jgi:hypothetical protein
MVLARVMNRFACRQQDARLAGLRDDGSAVTFSAFILAKHLKMLRVLRNPNKRESQRRIQELQGRVK